MRLKAVTTLPIVSCVKEIEVPRGADSKGWKVTIRCYHYPLTITGWRRVPLTRDRQLAAQAMTLLMGIDRELRYARAGWNEDRFRRIMRLRPKAVTRLRRRWEKLSSSPRIPLWSLRRRYHANLAGHLYPVSQD